MFATIKEEVDILQVAEELLRVPFKQIGDSTFAPEDETCPHCNHRDCYRIKKDGSDSFYKCFSCDATGDVITMYAVINDVSNIEAAKALAKKYSVKLPRDYSPLQEAMDMAAGYYHTCLLEAGPCAELGGQTPVEYQQERRGHTPASLEKFQIGWSDGKLVDYLRSLGVDDAIIKETGLENKAGKDFLPARSFIYPHKVRGRASHFTFKDPLKQKEWQLPNKHKLNNHSFYNSDSLKNEGPVIVVEGENDAISVDESGWMGGLICCNGSISQSQIDWMALNLKDREVITIFDSDAAGDKYREKVGKIGREFSTLLQVKLSNGVKDIDEYLKAGGDLVGLLTTAAQGTSTAIEIGTGEDEDNDSSIIEERGAYFKRRYKDGNEFRIKLCNFTIELRNIFIRANAREREIVIVREDGKKSEPIMIQSEAKVSLKPFKTLVANAIDASFYGKEEDMIAIWEHVYKTSKEIIVHLPACVGYVDEFNGWLFRDCFISVTGAVYKPDEKGVIWIDNRSVGLRAISMESNAGGDSMSGVPKMLTELKHEEREELIGHILKNLSANLGQPGMALTVLSWAWASVYSQQIYDAIGHFPFIYLWGRGGRGKTTIIKWVLSFYDLEHAWVTANQLNSGVSFSRKLSYYSSLPMCVDEIRVDQLIKEMYGTFRGWYNRASRSVAAEGGFGIRTQPVRSTVMFGGEDQFADQSTRERCIHLRIPKHGREEKESYKLIDARRRDLPAVGYHWIQGFSDFSIKDILEEVKELDDVLRARGVSPRTSLNWAIVAFFGLKLAKKHMPDFDYMAYLTQAAGEDLERQKEDDAIIEFWTIVEGIQAQERALIGPAHLRRIGSELHVWFAEVFRIVEREGNRGNGTFSRRAIQEALREEDCFIREDRTKMGMNENIRRVMVFDLDKAPDVLNQIAGVLQS
jgi:5S rRNA maturation endonuclease (ribonuclease M5)